MHIPNESALQVAAAAYRVWEQEEETLRRIGSAEFLPFSGPEIKH